VPVLVLRGRQTRLTSLWGESEQHIARHVRGTHVRELPDLGHFAPVLAPELLAEELISSSSRTISRPDRASR
jgi:pimeloyl-ACP methyl ester carboxylesterase